MNPAQLVNSGNANSSTQMCYICPNQQPNIYLSQQQPQAGPQGTMIRPTDGMVYSTGYPAMQPYQMPAQTGMVAQSPPGSYDPSPTNANAGPAQPYQPPNQQYNPQAYIQTGAPPGPTTPFYPDSAMMAQAGYPGYGQMVLPPVQRTKPPGASFVYTSGAITSAAGVVCGAGAPQTPPTPVVRPPVSASVIVGPQSPTVLSVSQPLAQPLAQPTMFYQNIRPIRTPPQIQNISAGSTPLLSTPRPPLVQNPSSPSTSPAYPHIDPQAMMITPGSYIPGPVTSPLQQIPHQGSISGISPVPASISIANNKINTGKISITF